jgi:hypothetical protein
MAIQHLAEVLKVKDNFTYEPVRVEALSSVSVKDLEYRKIYSKACRLARKGTTEQILELDYILSFYDTPENVVRALQEYIMKVEDADGLGPDSSYDDSQGYGLDDYDSSLVHQY